jgi:FSR family fosmidomycin resistance protein-like MFS transporter
MFRRLNALHAVAISHFIIDIFNSMGPIVLTFLSAHVMSLSKTQIGLAASSYSLVHGLTQPIFGWRADQSGGRRLAAVGIVWTAGLLLLAFAVGAVTGQFWLLLALYVLAPLGSAAFHPIGTMYASVGSAHGSTGRLSWFFLAGFAGAAVGPVLTGVLLDSTLIHEYTFVLPQGSYYTASLGTHGSVVPLFAMWLLLIPAVLALLLTLPNAGQFDSARQAAPQNALPTRVGRLPLLLLGMVILLRSIANPGAIPFLPGLFAAKGWSAAEYGSISSAFWLAGAVLGLVAGRMADRYGGRIVVALTLLLTAPAYWLLPQMDGAGALLVSLAAGGLSGASHSPLVAAGQRLLPRRQGLASGAVLGFVFAAGALGTFLLGILSDAAGLASSFHAAALSAALAGALSWWVLRPQRLEGLPTPLGALEAG